MPMTREDFTATLTHDDEAGAWYVHLSGPLSRGLKVTKTVVVNKDLRLDFDRAGRLRGVEILNPRLVPGP